jgi:hypothetical protein
MWTVQTIRGGPHACTYLKKELVLEQSKQFLLLSLLKKPANVILTDFV